MMSTIFFEGLHKTYYGKFIQAFTVIEGVTIMFLNLKFKSS
jgi:TM2 domain-containing membrane protein YozV